MRKVCVLLSTYNGEQYIKEQIDSILNQKGVETHLFVRDDGSTDNTVSIIKAYNSRHIELLQAKNIGCENSFNLLMKHCKCDEYDFFAFSDQDDVWFNNKLLFALNEILKENGPILYCANQIITDNLLKEIRLMILDDEFSLEKKRMEYNYFLNRHGCTMVWNRELMRILKEINKSEMYLSYHDKWVNLVARVCGKVIISNKPLQYYRIHQSNVSGFEDNLIARIKKGIKLYWYRDNNSHLYALDCLKYLERHPEYINNTKGQEYVRVVAEYKNSLRNRIKLAAINNVGKTKLERVFWKISILLGKY